jgi:hypothetical protein
MVEAQQIFRCAAPTGYNGNLSYFFTDLLSLRDRDFRIVCIFCPSRRDETLVKTSSKRKSGVP